MSAKAKATLTKADMACLRKAARIMAPVFAAHGWTWASIRRVPTEGDVLNDLVEAATRMAGDEDITSLELGRLCLLRTCLGLRVYLSAGILFGRKWERREAEAPC